MSFGKGKNEGKLWCGQSGALIKMEKDSENILCRQDEDTGKEHVEPPPPAVFLQAGAHPKP
jgi:hypothetical protein